MNVIDKLFFDDAYGIAIRRDKGDKTYYTKYPVWRYWYADPFVCNHNGKEYVFVEAMDYYKGIGHIAVAGIDNLTIGNFEIVLEEDFHMSFPNVFSINNEWYMIPETSACNQLRLYKSISFPYKWKLEDVLVKNRKLVDRLCFCWIQEIFLLILLISHLSYRRTIH